MASVMNPGERTHKCASVRVAIPTGLPTEMWEPMRELVSLKSEDQARGEATSLMWTVCAEADRSWKTLMVHPEPFASGLSTEKLEKFYAKFGFSVLQTEPVVLMVRSPQKPKIARAA